MKFSIFSKSKSQHVIDTFNNVFSASEWVLEGQVIADFVSRLIDTTKPQDLIGCIAEENEHVVGCLFFSRFTLPSKQVAFILSPLAIATDLQGKGIGQKLIQFGLDHLRSQNVNWLSRMAPPPTTQKLASSKSMRTL